MHKEKLEWDAFKTFLSDFAAIRKYAPEDVSMWKEWLIYGTALGVGDEVVKAMEKLQVSVPEVHATTYMPMYLRTRVEKAEKDERKGMRGDCWVTQRDVYPHAVLWIYWS